MDHGGSKTDSHGGRVHKDEGRNTTTVPYLMALLAIVILLTLWWTRQYVSLDCIVIASLWWCHRCLRAESVPPTVPSKAAAVSGAATDAGARTTTKTLPANLAPDSGSNDGSSVSSNITENTEVVAIAAQTPVSSGNGSLRRRRTPRQDPRTESEASRNRRERLEEWKRNAVKGGREATVNDDGEEDASLKRKTDFAPPSSVVPKTSNGDSGAVPPCHRDDDESRGSRRVRRSYSKSSDDDEGSRSVKRTCSKSSDDESSNRLRKELNHVRGELSKSKKERDELAERLARAEAEASKSHALVQSNMVEVEEARAEAAEAIQAARGEAGQELNDLQARLHKAEVRQAEEAAARREACEALRRRTEERDEKQATGAMVEALRSELGNLTERSEADRLELVEAHKEKVEGLEFMIRYLKGRVIEIAGDIADNGIPEKEPPLDACDISDGALARALIDGRDEKIQTLELELDSSERARRMVHNRLQELRGNIRVCVRVRPFVRVIDISDSGAEDDMPVSPVCVLPGKETIAIMDRSGDEDSTFTFDKVFNQSAGQDDVFSEVKDFVQSAIDGYNVCLFSYGQTGSGKTHTMSGLGSGDMRGIVPRAAEQILAQARALAKKRWEFDITAGVLEIYNESLKDLLLAESDSSPKLMIRKDKGGDRTYVDGLSYANIDTTDESKGLKELSSVLATAARSRSVAYTSMSNESSRSHTIFVVNINGTNTDTGTVVSGRLFLCDLAGSERLHKIRVNDTADKKHLRETQSINKSLSCLGDVFNSLACGSSHVPYRNSKLTYLLQDCLGRSGKSLMFVNLSPTMESCRESVFSLRFAQRVNQIELGKATQHKKLLSRQASV